MRFATIKLNDAANAPGIAVSIYLQGCPHHCVGCFNPETWSFTGGKEFTMETLNEIIEGLTANGIERSLCILGGEPLCPENEFLTHLIISSVKEKLPNVKVYIWSGYTYEELQSRNDERLKQIFEFTNVLIDGPYIEALRDITLPMRGSSNQNIIYLH